MWPESTQVNAVKSEGENWGNFLNYLGKKKPLASIIHIVLFFESEENGRKKEGEKKESLIALILHFIS